MSFIFSRALVEACLQDNYSGIDASALLSGSPTPPLFLPSDKTMAFSRLSRFGMTFGHLTEDHGEALLTSWLAASRARTSALQEKAQESTASGRECGRTWRASLAKFDPDSSTWKTAQPSLLGASEEFSVTWPRSGMTAGGECWELPMLERRTNETGSGLSGIPTPCAQDGSGGGAKVQNLKSQVHLRDWAKTWPTPTSTLGTNGGRVTPAKAREGGTLIEALSARTVWPTPVASDTGLRSKPYAQGGTPLSLAVTKFPTPSTLGVNGGSNSRAAAVKRGQPSAEVNGGSLNPMWVEWLMRWPLGWTDLRPLETGKCQPAPQKHSGNCQQLLSEAAA